MSTIILLSYVLSFSGNILFGNQIFLQAGGGCDSSVAYGTAVATFNSKGNYNGHAGAFIECSGNNLRVSCG